MLWIVTFEMCFPVVIQVLKLLHLTNIVLLKTLQHFPISNALNILS